MNCRLSGPWGVSGVKPARGGFDKDTRWVRDTLLNEETRSMKESL